MNEPSEETERVKVMIETLEQNTIQSLSNLSAKLETMGNFVKDKLPKVDPPIDKIAIALAKAQAKMQPAVLDMENPAFSTGSKKSKYASLLSVTNAIREPLTSEGIAWTSRELPGYMYETRLIHGESGQVLSTSTKLDGIQEGRMQSRKSARTYAQRFNLIDLTGIAAEEDDDGNASSGDPQSKGSDGNKGSSKPAASSKPKGSTTPKGKDEKPPEDKKTEGKKEAPKTPPPTGLTKAQVDDLVKLADSKEWKLDQVKAFVNAAYGLDTATKCNAAQLEELRGVIESMKPDQAIAIAKGEAGEAHEEPLPPEDAGINQNEEIPT